MFESPRVDYYEVEETVGLDDPIFLWNVSRDCSPLRDNCLYLPSLYFPG